MVGKKYIKKSVYQHRVVLILPGVVNQQQDDGSKKQILGRKKTEDFSCFGII